MGSKGTECFQQGKERECCFWIDLVVTCVAKLRNRWWGEGPGNRDSVGCIGGVSSG